MSTFMHTRKNNILLHLQAYTDSNNYHILMKEIIIWFSRINFFFFFLFFIIISIILNFSSYFNLVFGLIFSYTIWGYLMDSCMYILKFLWLITNEINPFIHPASHLLTQSSIHSSIHPSMNQESYENWFVGFLVIWCSKGPKFPVWFFSQFWAAIMDILITLKY